jgi:hypothetical protein
MGPRTIRGIVGRVDWGYFAAAAINNYSATPLADGSWSLHATVVSFDAFKIRQKPLIFVAPHKDGEWRWPIRTVDLSEGAGPRELRATLGQQLPEMVSLRGHG